MPTLHLILGDQPKSDGTLSAAHRVRIHTVLHAAKAHDTIVCTGGVTVSGSLSEAMLASNHLSAISAKERKLHILLEDKSMTTAQNFRYSQAFIAQFRSHRVVVYCGRAQLPKARILQWWYWPKGRKVKYVPLADLRGWEYRFAQLTIGTLLAVIDPYEVWIARLGLGRLLRRQVTD